jgi:hypothetical protein
MPPSADVQVIMYRTRKLAKRPHHAVPCRAANKKKHARMELLHLHLHRIRASHDHLTLALSTLGGVFCNLGVVPPECECELDRLEDRFWVGSE